MNVWILLQGGIIILEVAQSCNSKQERNPKMQIVESNNLTMGQLVSLSFCSILRVQIEIDLLRC